MPIAAAVTSPVWAIIIMMSFDIFGPIALLPRAWRDGEPTAVPESSCLPESVPDTGIRHR